METVLTIAFMVHGIANANFTHCSDPEGQDNLALISQIESQKCGDCEDLAYWRFERMILEGVDPSKMQIGVINGNHAVLQFCTEQNTCYQMDHGIPIEYINKLSDHVYDIRTQTVAIKIEK